MKPKRDTRSVADRIREAYAAGGKPGPDPYPPTDEGPGDPEPEFIPAESPPPFEPGDAWEGPKASANGHSGGAAQAPKFRFRSSAEFMATDYQLRWLVKRLLVEGQPGVIGGPKKSLKTSLLVELAYSLGTGAPFLGRFDVAEPVRVGIMSGESGEFSLKDTAQRVCRAKGVDPRCDNVACEFTLPRLADAGDLDALAAAIQDAALKILLIDPLYLCILNGIGATGLQASNMFHMGPLFQAVARTCLDAGCTPLLAHHFKLTRANPYEEPQLEDLAFSGIQEFSRQWLLLGRRERFAPGSGQHKLWLSVGGSAGQSGLWALDVDEGAIDDDLGGREWRVSVQNASDVRTAQTRQKEEGKAEDKKRREAEEEKKLLGQLDRLDAQQEGVGYTRVRNAAGFNNEKMGQVAERLLAGGLIEIVPELRVGIGSKAKRGAKGLRRIAGGGAAGPGGTSHSDHRDHRDKTIRTNPRPDG